MKSLMRAAAAATLLCVLCAPVATFAQSNGTLTRAQVKAEAAQLEQAGYVPGSDPADYPSGLQAAQARVQTQSGESINSGYGGIASHSSQSGARMVRPGERSSIYFGD
jgi:hypothetical protein